VRQTTALLALLYRERRATGHGKTVTDSPAHGRARYRSQGRLSSWFVRLCVKSGRFVTSGHCGIVGRFFRMSAWQATLSI
jgi:hypothetical protein